MTDTRLVKGLCSCLAHREGATKKIDHHVYRLEEEEISRTEGLRWRWRCSCKPRAGRWTYQSNSVAYHRWLRHVGVERW